MDWKFWRNDRRDAALENLESRLTEIGEQVSKLSRLQYKTSQDVQAKVERLGAGVERVLEGQLSHVQAEERIQSMERKQRIMAESLINWLDDLDHMLAGFQEHDRLAWKQLYTKWTQQLLTTLASLEVYELNLLGSSFDPRYAESIKTVQPGAGTDSYEPYEIVEIVKRGFQASDGSLLRKAQVVTIQGGESYV